MELLRSKGISETCIAYLAGPCDFIRNKKTIEAFVAMQIFEADLGEKKAMQEQDIEDSNSFRRIQRVLDENSFAFFDLTGSLSFERLSNIKRKPLNIVQSP